MNNYRRDTWKASSAVGMIATYLDVNKMINYINDRLLVEIQMGHVEYWWDLK